MIQRYMGPIHDGAWRYKQVHDFMNSSFFGGIYIWHSATWARYMEIEDDGWSLKPIAWDTS